MKKADIKAVVENRFRGLGAKHLELYPSGICFCMVMMKGKQIKPAHKTQKITNIINNILLVSPIIATATFSVLFCTALKGRLIERSSHMKVLAINGSARKDGNTAILIHTVFEELHQAGIETEMVQLSGKIKIGRASCRERVFRAV